MMRRLFRTRPRWVRDRSGVAIVEFALVLPLLLLIYLGGFEYTQATSAYRKMSDTTVELANVAAQYTSMTSTDADSVMTASSQIMAPDPTSNLKIVLTEVTTDAGSVATVTWSRAYNGGAKLTPGSVVALPTGMASPLQSYVLVQTTYKWTPPFTSTFFTNVPMSDQVFMIPRNSAAIPCPTC